MPMLRRALRHAEARGGEELVFETRILVHAGFLRTAKLHGIQRTQEERKTNAKNYGKAVARFGNHRRRCLRH
jgi:hypothetical protein